MANSPARFEGYDVFLTDIKQRIHTAQVKAKLAVNQELILLYWQIGHEILTRQDQQGWGSKVIDQLAKDLRKEFPEMTGFSPRSLKYMRAFAEAYTEDQIVPQLVAQIPWGHHRFLLDKVKDADQRQWYIQKTIENGWSRTVLVHQIESNLFARQGGAITNFDRALPKLQSDLAQELLKDPYHLEFLGISEESKERDLETALLQNMRDFLLELGVGFAFMGNQYRLEVGGDEFFIDLLFYHVKLRCYVVIDLKMTAFKPEYSGKMNFYVAAIDDLLRSPDDQPTIGLVLCKSRNKTVIEYSLRDMNQAIGVSTYHLGDQLPALVQENLPSIEQLQQTLEEIADSEQYLRQQMK
ncbi:MAG: PDDEXK nuclease domain-containing protein [Thermosynechococcaceae cyanobacterium]